MGRTSDARSSRGCRIIVVVVCNMDVGAYLAPFTMAFLCGGGEAGVVEVVPGGR